MSESTTVETIMELLAKRRTAKQGDVCECKEMKTTFIFNNNGWDAIKTTQEGYEQLYGDKEEH